MTRHVLDTAISPRSRRARHLYLALDALARRAGLSRRIVALDRARQRRKDRKVAAFAAIARGRQV